MKRFPWSKLVEFGVRFLTGKGVAEENARYISETAVTTEAYGIRTHGMAVFPYFEKRIGKDLCPTAEPEVVRDHGAVALVDGHSGFGQLGMRVAVGIARKKAKEFGIGMVGVRNVSWTAALGVYLIPLAREGLLAQLWTQTSSTPDCAPFGGIDPRMATNPVAFAFPTESDPVISDISTTAVSQGKVSRMIRRGEKAVAPLFMDKDGVLSNDPKVVRQGGSILPLGGNSHGHKGYGISLWNEAVTATAGGRCNDPDAEFSQTANLIAIDPGFFAGADSYETEMRRFIAHVKSSRVRPGFREIRLPGERGLRELRQARELGVPLEDEMVEHLNKLAERNSIPPLM